MKKSILNLGKVLNKTAQKQIKGKGALGGRCWDECASSNHCLGGQACNKIVCENILVGVCSEFEDPTSL